MRGEKGEVGMEIFVGFARGRAEVEYVAGGEGFVGALEDEVEMLEGGEVGSCDVVGLKFAGVEEVGESGIRDRGRVLDFTEDGEVRGDIGIRDCIVAGGALLIEAGVPLSLRGGGEIGRKGKLFI